jgi:hypothetical protein
MSGEPLLSKAPSTIALSIHRYFIEELTMTYRAYPFAGEYRYLNDGWRFSDARSVSAATSDRASTGGLLVKRCPTITES